MQKRSLKQKCLAWLLSLAVAVTFIPFTAGFAFADDPDVAIEGAGPVAAEDQVVTAKDEVKEITDADVTIPAGNLEDGAYAWTGEPIYPMPVVTVNGEELTCKSVKIKDGDPEVLAEDGQFTVEYPDSVNNSYTRNGTWNIIVKGTGDYSGEVTKQFNIKWGAVTSFTVKETNGLYEDAASYKVIKSDVCPIEDWESYVQHGKITSAWKKGDKKATTSSYIPLNTILSKYNIRFNSGDVFAYNSVDNNPATLSYEHLTTNVYGADNDGNPVDMRNSIRADGTKFAFVLAIDDPNTNNNPMSIAGNDSGFSTLNGMQAALKGIISVQVVHPVNIADAVEIDGMKAAYVLPDEGGAVEPEFTVKDGNYTLKNEKNKDYTVTYSNNTEIGVGTVSIAGVGGYNGTIEKTFVIASEAIVETVNDTAEQLAQATAQVDLLLNPVNASVSGVTTNSGTINLSTAADVDGYIVNGTEQTANTFAASGLAVGSSNKYTVKAYKTVGEKKLEGQEMTVYVNTKPGTVTNAPKVSKARKAITVKSWAKAAGAANYEISVSRNATDTVVKATKASVKKTKIKKLKKKKVYYVKVRAISPAGVAGDWSPVKKIKTK